MSESRLGGLLWGGFILMSLLGAIFLFPQEVRAEIIASDLVISEIQTGLSGSGNSQKDFIEVYNATDHDIDLDGYRLVKRTKNGTTDTTIKSWTVSTIVSPKSYYLWTNSNYSELVNIADTTTTQSIADDNAIALRLGPADSGAIIDAVAWGENVSNLVEGVPYAQNIPDDQSLERLTDTGNNLTDFTLQSSPTPRQPSANNLSNNPQITNPVVVPGPEEGEEERSGGGVVLPQAEVLITEIMPNPDGADSGREWIEVYNAGESQADISGWIFDDKGIYLPKSSAYVLPENTVILPNSYEVVLIPRGNFALNNDGDVLRFFDDSQALLQQVSYIVGGKEGQSYARSDSGPWSWTDNVTPGAENIISIPQIDKPEDQKSIVSTNDPYKGFDIVFNEVFGNPEGADLGHEWIELKNRASTTVDLAGWLIDDSGGTISSNAFTLPTGSIITARGLLLINLSDESSFITNTKENLRLLSPDKQKRLEIILPPMLEGKSYARLDNGESWQYSFIPTPGAENTFISQSREIVFSEIYFRPASDDEDFIELYNNEDSWVSLSGWKLELPESKYTFPEGASIPAKSFLVLTGELINVKISEINLPQLKLVRPDGQVQTALENNISNMLKLSVGQSLIINPNRVEITNLPTPGFANKLVQKTISTLATSVSAGVGSVLGTQSRKFESPVGGSDLTSKVALEGNLETKLTQDQELPIIIEKKEKTSFFHRIGGFFCSLRLFLLKC